MNSLRIGHLTTAYHSNFILMANTQLETDLGLPVEWILFDNGPDMMMAFYKNQLEAGYLGLTPAMIGISKGVPMLCVAGGHIEGTILCSKPIYKTFEYHSNDLKNTFEQFIGKTIGVPKLGSIHSIILLHYLKEFGLDAQIGVKYYDIVELIALDLIADKIAAGMGTPSLLVFAQTMGNVNLTIPPTALWPNNPSYGVFFHKKIIAEAPHLVKVFLKHNYRAELLLRNEPQIAAEKIASVFKIIDSKYVRNVINISPKYCIALDDKFRTATMQLMREMIKFNLLERELNENEIFYTEFLNELHPPLSHYEFANQFYSKS